MWGLLRAPRALARLPRMPLLTSGRPAAFHTLLSSGVTTIRASARPCTHVHPSPCRANPLCTTRPLVTLSMLVRGGGLPARAATLHASPCMTPTQWVRSMRSRVGQARKGRGGGHRMGAARAQPRKRSMREKMSQKFKLKTHKGAAKRFKLRGNGTWVYTATGKKHLMAGSSRSRQTLRKLKKRVLKTKGLIKKLFKLMPYHKKRAIRRA